MKLPIADLHVDALLAESLTRMPFLKERSKARRPLVGHSNLEHFDQGGGRLILLGIVTSPLWARSSAVDAALMRMKRWARQDPRLRIVRSDEDIPPADQEILAMACIEGAHCLRDLDVDSVEGRARLRAFRHQGLAALGLAHFSTNRFAPAAAGWAADRTAALPKAGRALVRACAEEGIVLDLAHLGDRAFFEVLDILADCGRPALCSHTGIRRAHAHWRNLSDGQLRALASVGGVAGIIAAPIFLGRGAVVERMVAHIEAALEIAGLPAVALGSDFDGFIVPGAELPGAWAWPRLVDALAKRGWSDSDLRALCYENARRVLNAGRRPTVPEL